MKTWFPFSDYDFYSYLASGIVLLFAIDYWLSGGNWAVDTSWTIQQNILILILAYITGQIIAIPSSILYDTILVNKILGHPIEIRLGQGRLSYIDKVLGVIIGRDYSRLVQGVRKNIIMRSVADTKLSEDVLLANKRNIFDIAFIASRLREEDRIRIDDFRNQYGFSRNMSLTSFVAGLLMYHSTDVNARVLSVLFCFLGFGMLLRFVTCYAAFAAEVLRSYSFEAKTNVLEVMTSK